jgi:hypothetical protein
VAATATWVATGNENGGTGALSFTADGGNPFFALISMFVQIANNGVDPLTGIQTIGLSFDWVLTNGPMGTATAKSAFNSSIDGTDDVHGPGGLSGTYSRTDTGTNLGVPTFGDLYTDFATGTGVSALGFSYAMYYEAGTFSVHSRSLAISNFVITVTSDEPDVTGVSPSHGDAAGGTVVTLTGTNFTGATAVTFNGATAIPNVLSDTELTCVTPEHAVGLVTVTVT